MSTKPDGEPAVDVERSLSAQSEPVPSEPRPAWHRPTLTRIEIKRTMLTSGPLTDLETGTGLPSG
jgi:hypothetical protein